MKRVILLLVLTLAIQNLTWAQIAPPKREFRAAWLSTVQNIDWPSSPSNSMAANKNDLIKILDYLKAANLNAVVMQIRPACDAMYYSEIEPWSSWFTGQQGKAPAQFWDPLEFAVEEAHKRGMELHAWMNPYRVRNASWNLQLDKKNPAVQHPDWVLTVDGNQILNPGLPEVREHVVNVVMDVVRRYDIDAVHFDDYFYLEGISNQDDQTFAQYNRGFTDRGDWRRDNVNELLRMIYSGIQNEKPTVKFGQSPAGIWKSGVPPNIFGRSAYSAIYCDAVAWLNEQIIDYLAPQLYWAFGGGQDYGTLAPWWAGKRNQRHIYPGLPLYRVGESTMDRTQIGKMIKLNRKTDGIYGEVFFTSHNIKDNPLNNTDTLKNNYYKYKSIIPVMPWKDNVAPQPPLALRFGRVEGLGIEGLTWDKPADEDVARYVIYSFDSPTINQNDIEDATKIFDITSKNYYQITSTFPTAKKYYVVTALDHNNNESLISNVFEFQPSVSAPAQPTLAFPSNGANDAKDTVIVRWNYAAHANSYSLQVAGDNLFANKIVDVTGIVDTTYKVTGMTGEKTYYWRVKAVNTVGESSYSNVFSYTTAFPAAPVLQSPADLSTNNVLNPVLQWVERSDAVNYYLQVYEGLSIVQSALIVDTIMSGSSFQLKNLQPNTIYSWRMKVTNQYGTSTWSGIFKFRTISILSSIPMLLSPQSGNNAVPDSAVLRWGKAEYAKTYNLLVAYDINFSSIFLNQANIADTTFILKNLNGETDYFWKVRSVNNSGNSDYSSVFAFSTGFPKTPVVISPTDLQTNLSLTPKLKWTPAKVTSKYQVQLSQDVVINPNKMVADTTVQDTIFITQELLVNTVYSWRVKAFNDYGESKWTNVYKFKTIVTDVEAEEQLPKEFQLYQNYPNPFNPTTKIEFDLPKQSKVTLKIFNLLGQEIADLMNKNLAAGKYSVDFNASNLPSGIYFYKLTTEQNIYTRKMLLIR